MSHRHGIGSHQSARAKTTIWLTPPHILSALGPFDLDPCAAEEQPHWSGTPRHFTQSVDGLSQPWEGRVWCNPPYGAEAWRWLDRLADHGNGIALVFARTETAGFDRSVWQRADAVMFLIGRLHFHRPNGFRAGANSGAPSALVAYGEDNREALEYSGLTGVVIPASAWRRGSAG